MTPSAALEPPASSNSVAPGNSKNWISVLGLTLKMVHAVPNAGLIGAKDVDKVRAVAESF